MGAERGPAVREARAPTSGLAAIHDATGGVISYAPRVNAFAGRRTGGFGSGFEVGGSLTQDLSLHGLGGARRETATAIARTMRSDVESARLEGAAKALLAWIDLLEAQQLMRLRAIARADATEIARVANARVSRGVAMPAEASLAAAEVGASLLGEQDAEGRLFEVRAALKLALGLPQATNVAAVGDLETDDGANEPSPPRREHPVEIAAQSQIALAQADAKLARAYASPALGVGVNYAREGTGEQYITGALSVPLPILDPTRFDAARHNTTVLTAEARALRVHDVLAHDVTVTAHERAHTREVRDTLRTMVLVPLREAVRLARAGYQAGTQDATGLLVVRQRLVLAEEQLGRAAADVKRADVRSAVARGTLLDEVSR
jgi:outer membrane protein TolC